MSEPARIADFAAYHRRRHFQESWSTKKQIAAHLGFSTRWVEYRVAEGMRHRMMGGQMRFRASECEAWLQERAGQGA